MIQNNNATQTVLDNSNKSTFDLSTFKKAVDNMIATNGAAYSGINSYFRTIKKKTKTYTPEEIANIIESGSLIEQRELSQNYFRKDGLYKRILIYYATLLKYTGILIPNPSYGKKLSADFISKRYYNAVNFLEQIKIPAFLTECAIKAYMYGCYYGVIQSLDKRTFSVLELPIKYCCSNFKDIQGNDIIEFDVTYFDTILNETNKNTALLVYPKVISDYYKKFKKGKVKSPWMTIPSDIGICFPLFDEMPPFLNVIPATIDYDEAVDIAKERDLEEIKKIIVQKVPHLNDGSLLFEPEEAEIMHKGSVNMMKSNKNVSVLTTYTDVDSIISKTAAETATNSLEKMINNVYYQAGASGQLFAPTGNLALETSIKNDLSLALILARKFENFITNIVNKLYSNNNINFKYTILPITLYNESEYIENSFKLASSGYSLILPMLGLGFTQNDLSNIKELENELLQLTDKLIPLKTSYTQSGNDEGGAPEKKVEEKSEKTLENLETLNKGGSA